MSLVSNSGMNGDGADEVESDGVDEVDSDGAVEDDSDGADSDGADSDGVDEVDSDGVDLDGVDEAVSDGADEVDSDGADSDSADSDGADSDGVDSDGVDSDHVNDSGSDDEGTERLGDGFAVKLENPGDEPNTVDDAPIVEGDDPVDHDAAQSKSPRYDSPDLSPVNVSFRPSAQPATAPVSAGRTEPAWRVRDFGEVLRKVLAVLVVLSAIGYGLGMLRGESYTSRSEFVYSLEGSVPDGFLREDRRLLTQIVTFTSDAVLGPVAEVYDLEVEELRAKIDLETVDLSEVLRLEVTDSDPDRAMDLNRAVLDQHLRTVTGQNSTEFSTELIERRAELEAELETAVAAVADEQAELASLEAREQELGRRIVLIDNRIDRIQALQDEALGEASITRDRLNENLESAVAELSEIEAALLEVRLERAGIESRLGDGSPARRTIDRLEDDLTAVDAELSRRNLDPVVGSALRELSEPTLITRSRHVAGLQGLAVGMLLGLPVAAWVGYRTRRRQLWFG